jgi:predicted nucleic acid-binding protein
MAGTEPVAVVCDAGPLIHLHELGCLDLLGSFRRVLVPSVVWNEVSRHRPQALREATVEFERVEAEGAVTSELEALSRALVLHPGEKAALQFAQREPGCWLLSDDTAARLAARSLGMISRGSIGIVLRALRRKERTKTEVLNVLRGLPQNSSLHIKASLLAQIIREVEAAE